VGSARQGGSVKLFVGIFSADQALFPDIKRRLERIFGPTDSESPVIDFAHTGYYAVEFGTGLRRQFFTFRRSRRIEGIHRAKILTNRLENRFMRNGKRRVNIDPGYLTLSKVALLTTKDYTHRIHLGAGIYAEVTLYYKDGSYRPWPWTYPDYRSESFIGMFNRMRDRSRKEVPGLCS